MALKKPILLGLAAVIGYYFIRGAGIANIVGRVKFILRGISFQGLNLVVKIGVLNPTSTTVNFTAFVGDLLVGNKVVATAQSFTPVKIARLSQSEISIMFVPNSFGIVELITGALNKQVDAKVSINGWANMNSFTLPVKLTW